MNSKISIIGFNSEYLDPILENYHLGNGYRAYNPTLMQFTAPDDMSPFGKGGINPYLYCNGDPINNTDPTGHFTIGSAIKFLTTNPIAGTVFNVLAIGASIALEAGTLGAATPAVAAAVTTEKILLTGGLKFGVISGIFGIGVKWVSNPEIKKALAITAITTGIIAYASDLVLGAYGAYKWIQEPTDLGKITEPVDSTLATTETSEGVELRSLSTNQGMQMVAEATEKQSITGSGFLKYATQSYTSKTHWLDKFTIGATLFMRVATPFGMTAAILANTLSDKKSAALAGQWAVGIGMVNSLLFAPIGFRSMQFFLSSSQQAYNLNPTPNLPQEPFASELPY